MAARLDRWKYRYQALPNPRTDIRLLSFLPSSEGSEIRCALTCHSVHDTQVYSAGSYEWGKEDPANSECIYLDETPVWIRPNLWLFLFRLNRDGEPNIGRSTHNDKIRYFWIDAICIDQNNSSEKALQVALMARIYSQAECVVTWLGQSWDPITKHTFDFIREVTQPLP